MPLAGFRSAIQRLIIPTGDLGMQEQAGGVLHFPDDLPPTLAIGAALSQGAPRLVNGTKLGLAVPGKAFILPLYKQQVSTTNGNSADIDVSGFRVIQLYVALNAISGTSPTFSPRIYGLFPDGNYLSLSAPTANMTATGFIMLSAGVGAVNAGSGSFSAANHFTNQFPDTVRMQWFITGTGPSITFTAYLLAW